MFRRNDLLKANMARCVERCSRRDVTACAGLVIAYNLPVLFVAMINISTWALGDSGAHTVLVRLLASGFRPNLEFGYSYGPATVLLNYWWGSLWGNSWPSFLLLQLALRAALIVVLLWTLYSLALPRYLAVLLSIALCWFLPFEYSIAHAGEKIGLVLMLVSIMAKRPSTGVGFGLLAALFRPGATVLVPVLLLAVHLKARLAGLSTSERLRSVTALLAMPALFVVPILSAYAALWGFKSLVYTALPIAGIRMYEATQSSRLAPLAELQPRFLPNSQNWKGYLLANPGHVKILCLFVLAYLALIAIRRICDSVMRSSELNSDSALPLAGLGVMLAFALTYGSGAFYNYYTPLMWLALPALARLTNDLSPRVFSRAAMCTLWLICINVMLTVTFSVPHWREQIASVIGFDGRLKVSESLGKDIEVVRASVGGRPVAVLPIMGDVELLRPYGINALDNRYWCLRRGFNLERELTITTNNLAAADFVLVRTDHFDAGNPVFKGLSSLYHGRVLSLLSMSNSAPSRNNRDPKSLH